MQFQNDPKIFLQQNGFFINKLNPSNLVGDHSDNEADEQGDTVGLLAGTGRKSLFKDPMQSKEIRKTLMQGTIRQTQVFEYDLFRGINKKVNPNQTIDAEEIEIMMYNQGI